MHLSRHQMNSSQIYRENGINPQTSRFVGFQSGLEFLKDRERHPEG